MNTLTPIDIKYMIRVLPKTVNIYRGVNVMETKFKGTFKIFKEIDYWTNRP